MMTNLFSIFDPSMSTFSLAWSVCLIIPYMIPPKIWVYSINNSLMKNTGLQFKKEVEYVMKTPKKGAFMFTKTIFLLLASLNLIALFPQLFSATSHILINLPLSYSLWVATITFGWVKSMKHFLVHLVPTGTPLALMSFLVMVEILSSFIRPMALTFRLSANMMAGHLLMSLIGGALISMPFSLMLMGSLIQSLLVMLELGVAVIQAYVFSTLILIYLSESEN